MVDRPVIIPGPGRGCALVRSDQVEMWCVPEENWRVTVLPGGGGGGARGGEGRRRIEGWVGEEGKNGDWQERSAAVTAGRGDVNNEQKSQLQLRRARVKKMIRGLHRNSGEERRRMMDS